MHDRWKDEFEDAIENMSDSEKAEIIERLARSMKPVNGTSNLLSPAQVAMRLAEIAALSVSSPGDGFSARDHDSILYGSPRGPHSNS